MHTSNAPKTTKLVELEKLRQELLRRIVKRETQRKSKTEVGGK